MSLSTTVGTIAMIQRDAPPYDRRACLSCWVDGAEIVRGYLPPVVDDAAIYGSGVVPTMSSDGRWVAYAAFVVGEYDLHDTPAGCYVLDTSSGTIEHLQNIDGESFYSNRGVPASPWWSADGRLVSANGMYSWRPGSSVIRTLMDIHIDPDVGGAICPLPNCNGVAYFVGAGPDRQIIRLYDLETGQVRSTMEVSMPHEVSYIARAYQTGIQDTFIAEIDSPGQAGDSFVLTLDVGVVAKLGEIPLMNPPLSVLTESSTILAIRAQEPGHGLFQSSVSISNADWSRKPPAYLYDYNTIVCAKFSGLLLPNRQSIFGEDPLPLYLADPITGQQTSVLAPAFVRQKTPWVSKTGTSSMQVLALRTCSPAFVAYSPPGTFWQNMRYASEVMV